MCDPTLVTLLKMRPHYSQSSQGNCDPNQCHILISLNPTHPPPPRPWGYVMILICHLVLWTLCYLRQNILQRSKQVPGKIAAAFSTDAMSWTRSMDSFFNNEKSTETLTLTLTLKTEIVQK